MKINFPLLDSSLEISQATFLIVEDQYVFAQLVQNFYQYSIDSDLKVFDTKMKALKETEILVVTDILGYSTNSPAVLKSIQADLEEQLNDKLEVKAAIEKLASKITDLISYECIENELDLTFDDLTISKLITAMNIRVDIDCDSIFKKCLEIIQIFKYLTKKKLLVMINTVAYLSKAEVEQIIEYIQLNNISVLFLEPRQVYDFPQYVLDEDYILLEENML